MLSESQIAKTLTDSVAEFLERMVFFKLWKEGNVDEVRAKRFLISFDSLVKSFPGIIAAGAARTNDETTRGILALNLFQECGEGDVRRTHHAIYRKFLTTAGIEPRSMVEEGFSAEWRVGLSRYIQGSESEGCAIGAIVAGEFLAQPVLGRIYPILKTLFPSADQEYFTKHLLLEAEHVREMVSLISFQLGNGGEWKMIKRGFDQGLGLWESYFNRLTDYIAENN